MWYQIMDLLWLAFYPLFAVYLIWDWRQTAKKRREQEEQESGISFNKAAIAWGIKNLVAFGLVCTLLFFAQGMNVRFHNLRSFLQEGELKYGTSVLLLKDKTVSVPLEAVSDAFPLKRGENGETEIFINKGSIPVQSPTPYLMWLLLELATLCFYSVPLCFLLIGIFKPISQQKPFTLANVKRIRWLTILLIAYKCVVWVFHKINYWYVDAHYNFPIESHTDSIYYPAEIVVLCLALLVIAEMVKYGAEIKEEQDLTV